MTAECAPKPACVVATMADPGSTVAFASRSLSPHSATTVVVPSESWAPALSSTLRVTL